VHGIGIGSDRHSSWMLALTGACVLIVAAAIVARLTQHPPQAPQGARPRGAARRTRPSNRISALTPAAKQR
jgi:hypothetical protein